MMNEKLVHADVRNDGYFKALCRDLERQGVQPLRIPITSTSVTKQVPVVKVEKVFCGEDWEWLENER